MDLTGISIKTTVFCSLLGTCIQGYCTFFVRQPFEPLVPWYGFITLFFLGTFWFGVWCITPRKWWGE